MTEQNTLGTDFSTAVIDNGAFGTREITFSTGRLARQAAGSVRRPARRDRRPVRDHGRQAPEGAVRLLPADRRRRGADVRRGPHPRLVLPPRGPAQRGRDPHLPADRPAAAPVVRQGPAQRGPGRRDRSSRSTRPHPYDVVAINAASMSTKLSGLPFSGPIGATRMAHVDGQWVAFPTLEELARATFDMVVAGRVAARRRRRDHDGRGRGHRARDQADRRRRARADRGGRRQRPGGRQAGHPRAVPGAERAGRGRRQAGRRVPGLPRLPGRRLRGGRRARSATEVAEALQDRRQGRARGGPGPDQGQGRTSSSTPGSRVARRRSAPRSGR